jgi:hypothetical protein
MKTIAIRTVSVIVVGLIFSMVADSSEAGLLFRRITEDKKTDEVEASAKKPSILATAFKTQTQGPMLTLSPSDTIAPAMMAPTSPYMAGSYQETMPMPEATPMIVPPCISYRYAGLRHVKCCLPPIKTCLTYTDPCTCCQMCIPVCLPGCCTDCPEVSGRGAVLAKEVITYDWCCGVSVTVRLKRDGEILVTYRGV